MPPIIISRSTGEIISAPVLTQEQSDKLWEQIVQNHIRRHPELLRDQCELEGVTA